MPPKKGKAKKRKAKVIRLKLAAKKPSAARVAHKRVVATAYKRTARTRRFTRAVAIDPTQPNRLTRLPANIQYVVSDFLDRYEPVGWPGDELVANADDRRSASTRKENAETAAHMRERLKKAIKTRDAAYLKRLENELQPRWDTWTMHGHKGRMTANRHMQKAQREHIRAMTPLHRRAKTSLRNLARKSRKRTGPARKRLRRR